MLIRIAFAVALCAAPATAALAAEAVIPVVHSASAEMRGRTLVIAASVDLPNACWTGPHFAAPPHGSRPDSDGMVRLEVLATSTEGPGRMCAMIYRSGVVVPALHWTDPPTGLKAVQVIGSRTPMTARIGGPLTPAHP